MGESTAHNTVKSPPSSEQPRPSLFSRMVGSDNESEISICGTRTLGLVDTGSTVTCISELFYDSLDPKPELLDT